MKLSSLLFYEALPSIYPPLIPRINKEEDIQDNNFVNIKLQCTPSNTASDTYEFKMGTFESGSMESILHLLNNFNKSVFMTKTTSPVKNIVFLLTLFLG